MFYSIIVENDASKSEHINVTHLMDEFLENSMGDDQEDVLSGVTVSVIPYCWIKDTVKPYAHVVQRNAALYQQCYESSVS